LEFARGTRTLLCAIALTVVAALLLTSCGSQQGNETGAVSPETVKQLEDVLRARSTAIGKGDRDAFLQTIDTSRAAFRRIQTLEFDIPSLRGALGSSLKLSSVERHGTYIRGFVEETLEGNVFPGAFVEPSHSRRYFRSQAGKWILTEPTGDEVGLEQQRTAGGVELTYWGLDEDVASVYLAELVEARRQALSKSPKPLQIDLRVAFIPTAELAGPRWDGFAITGGGGTARYTYYPLSYSFDKGRTRFSSFTQNNLLFTALGEVRNGIVPGILNRLSFNLWLEQGWTEYASGIDVSPTLRQSCVGVPVPTLKQLADGPPPPGSVGVSPETYGRHSAYSASMIAYLYEAYGADAFWRLMSSFLQSASAATNFPIVLGVTPDQFYAAWLVWLQKKYC
jgi:hypothetical protein